ncbi:MAG: ral nucleoside transport system permease protein nupA [Chloroflexia bacterium]|jgi:simple sugar transport system permease protein|nr:ral nucleoside transport system permease protein nupA [Chloroflexia bacterium]
MNICGVALDILIASVLATTIRVATPLTLGALGGLFCERSGVVNIAIEGMMLMGAFSAYVVGVLTGSLWWGLVGAIVAAGLMGLLHALLSVTFKVDQIISGTVINILAFGLTGFFYDQFFNRNAPSPGQLPTLGIPVLSDLEIWGRLFNHQPVVWAALLLVAVTHFVIFFTPWGLRTRAVGEHPRAADTVGINVFFMRYANVIIGAGIAGLGGAYFTVEVSRFSPGITGGRGFIALAALIFGNWKPINAWLATLLFGFTQAIQINIQQCVSASGSSDLPFFFLPQIVGLLPYVVTIIVLAGFVGRSSPPAAVGVPYDK